MSNALNNGYTSTAVNIKSIEVYCVEDKEGTEFFYEEHFNLRIAGIGKCLEVIFENEDGDTVCVEFQDVFKTVTVYLPD